jgi:hypothetical protein
VGKAALIIAAVTAFLEIFSGRVHNKKTGALCARVFFIGGKQRLDYGLEGSAWRKNHLYW